MLYNRFLITACVPTYYEYDVLPDGSLGNMSDFEYGGPSSDSTEYYIYTRDQEALCGSADSVTAAKILIDRMVAAGVSHEMELA